MIKYILTRCLTAFALSFIFLLVTLFGLQPPRLAEAAPPQQTGGVTRYVATMGTNVRLFNDGAWHQVVVVKQGNQLQLYLDGVLAETATNNANFSHAMKVYIGGQLSEANFNGRMDDVALYQRALAAWEVANLYGQSVVTSTSNLMLLMRFDENFGTSVYIDSSGQNNQGFCTAPWPNNYCPSGPASGRFGNALSFNNDDTVEISNTVNFAWSDYSVSLWFNTTANSDQVLLSAVNPATLQPGIMISMDALGQVQYLHRAPTSSVGGSLIAPTDNNCTSPSYPCQNLQFALDIADANDTIKVAAGTYSQITARTRLDIITTSMVNQVAYITRNVTIQGGFDANFSNANFGTTSINPGNSGRGIYAVGNITVTLQNLQISNASAAGLGGGANLENAGSAVYLKVKNAILRHNNISNNSIFGNGAAVYMTGTQAILENNIFNNNKAPTGQLIETTPLSIPIFITETGQLIFETVKVKTITGTGGALYGLNSTLSVTGNSFNNNLASVDGGAIYLKDSNLTAFSQNTVNNNQAASGGAIYFDAITGSANLASNSFEGNSIKEGNGGAIYVQSQAITLTNNQIKNNSVISGSGGGAYLTTTHAFLDQNTIENNKIMYLDANDKKAQGGGVYLEGKNGIISNNVIRNNETHGPGGGLYLKGLQLSFYNNTVTGNKTKYEYFVRVSTVLTEPYIVEDTDPPTIIPAGPQYETIEINNSGGGLYGNSSSGVFTNNVFMANKSALDGGGLYFDKAGSLQLINNLIVKNSNTLSKSVGAGVYLGKSKAQLFSYNTIADNTNSDPLGSSFAVYVARASEIVGMTNNIISGHSIGVELEEDCKVEGSNNVWFNNSIKDWGTYAFKSPAIHAFGNPQFMDAANGNYQIKPTSAAFDAGDATLNASITTDLAGQPRIRGFKSDAGGYEQSYTHGVYLQQTVSEPFVADGNMTVYTVSVLNQSSQAVDGLQLTTQFPAANISSLSASQGSCGGGSCNISLGTLNVGDLVNVRLTLQVKGKPAIANSMLTLTNSVTVNFSGFDAADSDAKNDLAVYLQEVFSEGANGRMGEENNDNDAPRQPRQQVAPLYTGACSISMNGKYYTSISQAVGKSLRVDDVVRVSGYCGTNLTLTQPAIVIEPKNIKIQGGWPSNSASMPSDFTPSLDLYPTTLDGGRQGSVIKVIGEFQPYLENLIVTNGKSSAGGGIFIQRSSVVISGVRIVGNHATSGGGIYVDELSSPTIQGSVIERNSVSARGGGMYLRKGGAEIKTTIIRNNTGASDGGGVYTESSDPSFKSVTISGHSASGEGGGMYLDGSAISMLDSEISGNTARAGGGVFAAGGSPSIQWSKIINNKATASPALFINLLTGVIDWVITKGGGGGIHGAKSSFTVQYNVISGNSSNGGTGAGVHVSFSDQAGVKIDGNVIEKNTGGAGVFLWTTPSVFKFYAPQFFFLNPALMPGLDFLTPVPLQKTALLIRQNTFRNNSTALHVYGRTGVDLANNLFADNGTAIKAESDLMLHLMLIIIPVPIIMAIPIPIIFPTYYAPDVKYDYTLFYQNGSNLVKSGALGGAIFVSDSESNTKGGNPYFQADGYHINRISAAFEAGKNIGVTADMDRDPRPSGNYSDIGADEYVYRSIHYAKAGVSDADDLEESCTNWQKPCTLQAAIDAADNGDLVKVAVGTYNTVLTVEGLRQVAYISKSITLQGGYNPTDSGGADGSADEWETSDPVNFPTILDAGGASRVIFVGGEDNTVELLGLQIRNGDPIGQGGGDLPPSIPPDSGGTKGGDAGGGVFVLSASVTISNVQIYNNKGQLGAGVYLLGNKESAVLTSTLFGNIATGSGGGLGMAKSTVNLIDNEIRQNEAVYGGGFWVSVFKGEFKQNRLFDNQADYGGAGYFLLTEKQAASRDDQFFNNTASVRGGAIYMQASSADFFTATVTNNSAQESGGGFFFDQASKPGLYTSVIQQNKATNGAGIFARADSSFILDHTRVTANIASGNGGGIYAEDSSPLLNYPLIEANEAADGGGLYLDRAGGQLISATIISNKASRNGAGINLAPFSTTSFDTVTVTQNIAQLDGGGMYARLTSGATIRKSQIVTNTARYGAGMYIKLGKFTADKNLIANNEASLDGGGIFVQEVEDKTDIINNKIERNRARSGGGGYLTVMPGTVKGNKIMTNSATNDGGGLYVIASPANIEQNVIQQNQAITGSGGGLYVDTSAPFIRQNSVMLNKAQVKGGGMYLNFSPAQVTRNIIKQNQAEHGAAVFMADSSPWVANNVVSENELVSASASQPPTGVGSAFYIQGGAPTLVQTTIAMNRLQPTTAKVSSVAIYVTNGISASRVSLTNTILVSHAVGVQVVNSSNRASFNNTLWFGNGADTQGNGVMVTADDFRSDPAFEADGYHLLKNSKAVDSGLVVIGVKDDIDGDPRPAGVAFDLGADEYGVFCFAIVASKPDTVYNVVQQAVDAATPGDTVKVAGTCRQTSERNGLMQTVYLDKNITLQGGYTSANWETYNPTKNESILDAEQKGRVIVVASNAKPRIEGLHVTNGAASAGKGVSGGGGVYVLSGSPTLSQVQVYNNQGGNMGGGIYVEDNGATIVDTVIKRNEANFGGGLYLKNSAVKVYSSTVTLNRSTNDGAGMFLQTPNTVISQTVITGNVGVNGAGMFITLSPVTLTHVTVLTNKASSAGGGLYVNKSPIFITDSIVSENLASDGGGLYIDDSQQANLTQLTVNTNTVTGKGGGMYIKLSASTFSYSTLKANNAVEGGGVFVQDSLATLNGLQVLKNKADNGAGIYIDKSSPQLTNNVVVENIAKQAGGGFYVRAATPKLLHTTIARNTDIPIPTTGNASTGLYLATLGTTPSRVQLVNTILIMHGVGIYAEKDNVATLNTSVLGDSSDWDKIPVQNTKLSAGPGSVTQSGVEVLAWPGFANFEKEDYHLLLQGAAVDKGIDAGVAIDLDGQSRPRNNGYDIGADEVGQDVTPVETLPTIQSNGTGGGAWDNVASWRPSRLPRASDVILIQANDVITAISSTIEAITLINQGTLASLPGENITLKLTDMLDNRSKIIGQNGVDGTGDANGTPGSGIIIEAQSVTNIKDALIQGGNGGACENGQGGTGGEVTVKSDDLTNDGMIKAGNGGSCSSGDGGAGGAAKITATKTDNNGTIQAGDGGDSDSGRGGAGGEATVKSDDLNNSGEILAGNGGDSNKGAGGSGGAAKVTTTKTTNNGKIKGGDGGNGGAGDGGNGGAAIVTATDSITNNGQILGGNGGNSASAQGGDGGVAQATAVMVNNGGLIKGGDGGSGDAGGDGGGASVLAETITNAGTIAGGNGGDAKGAGDGGKGGAATAVATADPGDGSLTNTGTIAGGNGGNAVSPANGGDGGKATVMSDGAVVLDGGKVAGGNGGVPPSIPPDSGGTQGDVAISGQPISASGANTQISGNNVAVMGGPPLNVGTGVISATGQVTMAASPSNLKNDTVWVTNSPLSGQACQTLAFNLTLVNNGSAANSYTLAVKGKNGWSIGALTPTLTLAGLSSVDITLNVIAPANAMSGDSEVIELTAMSETDSTLSYKMELKAVIEMPAFPATIVSVQSGAWDDPMTWQPQTVPTADDAVWVQAGHVLTAPSLIALQMLRQEGQLSSQPQRALILQTSDMLHNLGQIMGQPGEAGVGSIPGGAGSGVSLQGSPICNAGTILAGAGGAGEQTGGAGGTVTMLGQGIVNSGLIQAGAGGAVTGLGLGQGGMGGALVAVANAPEPGVLMNTGTMQSGDGGAGNPQAINAQAGGDGGGLTLMAKPEAILSGGKLLAGNGGASGGGAPAGQAGDVAISSPKVKLAGPKTKVAGQKIEVIAGDDGLLDLSGVDSPALVAVETISLTTDVGVINLKGAGQPALQAGDGALLAADPILLDGTLAQVAGSNALSETAMSALAHTLSGPSLLTTPPDNTVDLGLLLVNSGVITDSYDLTMDSGEWSIVNCPLSVVSGQSFLVNCQSSLVNRELSLDKGLRANDQGLFLEVPATAISGTRQTVVVTATSQSQPDHVAVTTIEVLVTAREITPTIQSVTNGDWTDVNTWDVKRVPTAEDVVLVNITHTVKVAKSISVTGLVNRGILWVCGKGVIQLQTADFMENYGEVRGCNGADGSEISPAEPGQSLWFKVASLLNEKLIQAGDCGNGAMGSVDGGAVGMEAVAVNNYGTIQGGSCRKVGGQGGNAVVAAEANVSNQGLIAAGDGGAVFLMANPSLSLDGGQIVATNGSVDLAAADLSLAGSDTTLQGAVARLLSCEGADFNLSNLSAQAVALTNNLSMAVGAGGVMNLSGNPQQVLQAPNAMTLATDNLILGQGLSLAQVAGGNSQQLSPTCLAAIALIAPSSAHAYRIVPVNIPLAALNGGAESDTLTLTVSDTANWQISLAPTVTVAGLGSSPLALSVAVPSDSTAMTDIVTVQATSSRDPSRNFTVRIFMSLGGRIYLPIIKQK